MSVLAGFSLGVLVEEVLQCDGLVAAGAQPTVADADAGTLTVRAPLLAEVALVAVGAGVDGDLAAAPSSRDDGGGGGLSAAVGRLAAGLTAIALPAYRCKPDPADRTGHGCRHDVVTLRGSPAGCSCLSR